MKKKKRYKATSKKWQAKRLQEQRIVNRLRLDWYFNFLDNFHEEQKKVIA